MQTRLEDYLWENRDRLDTDQPDDRHIWKEIRKGQKRKGTFSLQWVYRVAAIGVFAVLSFYFVKNEVLKQPVGKSQLSKIDPSLAGREKEYIRMVDQKWETVREFGKPEDVVQPEYKDHLKLLDTLYRQALDDLQTYGNDERIVRLIFDTYEKRLRLLETIIKEEHKQQNEQGDEKATFL